MIIQEKIYPYIEIESDNRYIQLNTTMNLVVFLYTDESTKTDITNQCTLYSLDLNAKVDNYIIYPFEEGTFVVTALYGLYYTKKEFLVYSSFFKDNYLMNFMSQYDLNNIENDNILKALFDTLFEFIDIIYAYQKDLDGIKNPLKTKEKFLDILFDEFGLTKTESSYENDTLEVIASQVHRNILNKLLDILEIRGTLTSYELFFGVLGYDIEMFEFWFDENENLVEINMTDQSKSSFLKYNLNGELLKDQFQTLEDPRVNINMDNIYKNNKSNYIRMKYTKNSNLESSFVYPRSVIQEYLDYLKPNHINYLTEILALSANDENYYNPLDGEVLFNDHIGGDDEPPIGEIVTEYIATGLLNFNGTCINHSYQFIESGGLLRMIGTAPSEFSSSDYEFSSEYSILNIYGSSDTGRFEFESIDGALNIIDTGIVEAQVFLTYTPASQGVQTGRAIHWYDYLTQNDRDVFITGFKYPSHLGGIPSDFFSRDFRYFNKDKTYNEVCSFSKTLLLQDIISTEARYDSGMFYDNDNTYDVFSFLNESNIYLNPSLLVGFGQNELQNLYFYYKSSNPKNVGESDEDYKERISNMVIGYYLDLGVILNYYVLNEYLIGV